MIIFLIPNICFTKSQGYKITKGFKKDNYGTLFYYDEDNYYNDGWHLIDDNGDEEEWNQFVVPFVVVDRKEIVQYD